MPDGTTPTQFVDKAVDFTIRVACECYCSLDLVREALSQLPVCNGSLAWSAPSMPDQDTLDTDSDVILIVSDKSTLAQALDRLSRYEELGREAPSHILIYLQDNENVSAEDIAGLTLRREHLATGLTSLTRAAFLPIIPQGLICVDWCDTRYILETEGQIVIEEASASLIEDAIESAMGRLHESANGRPIHGMQASILCSPGKLATRYVARLSNPCREIASDDATIILAAPWMDWPDDDYYEVRILARVECRKPERIG